MSVNAMSSKEVAQKVMDQETLFILDVRNEDAFQDWKVEGSNFTYLNVPYFDLLDGVGDIMDQLPKDQDILVVCAKEGSSIMVAEMLSEEGLDVSYLSGGMKAWSEHLEPVKVGDLADGGELYQFVRLGKGCLSYMVLSGGEAAVIDATRMTSAYTAFAGKKEWRSSMSSIRIFMQTIFQEEGSLPNELEVLTGCHPRTQRRSPSTTTNSKTETR